MKAHRLREAGPLDGERLRLEEVPDPMVGAGELLLRVKACGVCRTDLHIVEGELDAATPLTPGHQAVGVVEAVGAGVKGFKPGDRVGACWLYSACGECRACREGRENLCPKARFTGLDAPGGFAEKLALPAAFAHRLPERYTDAELAPLLCAGAVGARALRMCKPKKGQRIGLYGFGSSAHLVLQLARRAGLEVFVFTRGRVHRELAEKLGAFWVGGAEDHVPLPLDSAILFAPAGELVPEALSALGPGGRLVLAGIHMSDLPSMPYRLLRLERSVRSVANVSREDVRHLLHEAERHRLRIEARPYPFDEANEALADLKGDRIGASAVLVR